MKNIIILPVVFLLCLTGCSTTYRVNKYYSKEELYNNFNNSCNNKILKITLSNDSSFIASEGAKISNDTLVLFSSGPNVNNTFINIDNVKEVNYKNNWLGLPFGLLTRTGVGFIVLAYQNISNGQGGPSTGLTYPVLCILSGGVIGWLVGYTYTYQFNP